MPKQIDVYKIGNGVVEIDGKQIEARNIEITIARDARDFNPYSEAIRAIQLAGHDVRASDIPGLTIVNGRELTVSQVLAFVGQPYTPKTSED